MIGFVISIYLLASKELFAAQAKKVVYAFSIKDFIKANNMAKIGTPMIIPKIPQIPPNNVIEKITQKLDNPVELPSI